jgi:hypothetical protein
MSTTTPSNSTAPRIPRQKSPPQAMEPDIIGRVALAMSSYSTAEHDPTLLVAALEEIDARQAAIEWLLEADLLRLCLV